MSDWTTPEDYTGESTAFSMSYVNTSSGSTLSGTYDVYEYSFDVDPTKTVVSITLPDNNNIMLLAATGIAPTNVATSLTATPTTTSDIELTWTAPSDTVSGYYVYRGQTSGGESVTALNGTELAADATSYVDTTAVPGNTYYYKVVAMDGDASSNEASAATPTAGPTTEVDLTSAFNFTGIVTDSSTFSSTGGLDGAGHALSATVLDENPSWNSIPFIYGAAGGDNVVQATGQTITLAAGQFSQLEILATAVSADQDSQIFTVNYADGTSQTFTQTISKWTDSGTAAISGYEDVYGGGEGSTVKVWGYTFNLNPAETVASITLPDNADVFLIGMTLRAANILPTGSAVNIADGALLELNGTDQQIGSLSGAAGSYIDLGGATLNVSGGGTTTFAGTIYGTGGFTYSGGGTLILSGADTHTGTTTVTSGWLQAGATDALSANTAYIVTSGGALEIGGDQTIASLSGGGEVIGNGTLTVGGDGTSTTFSGTLEDEDGASQLGLDKTGDGTLTLSGPNTYSGPTTIGAGTLEVDDNVNNSPVTIESGATLQGDGGTGAVTNFGGTYDPTLYKVTITDQYLQDEDGTVTTHVSLSTADGLSELVSALSPAAAAEEVLQVTGAPTDQFTYDSSFSDGSYSGQAFAYEGVSPAVGLLVTYGGDYFPISVVQDTCDPIAANQSYQDGVGGTLSVGAAGLLANGTSHFGSLSVGSVDGSTDSIVSTAHGSLTWNSDGSFSYTPNTGFFGTDTFTYIAYDGDGNQSNTATVTIQVLLPQIDLLDDANNDGVINSADEPVKDIGTGAIVLLSDDSTDSSSNADADHLAEVQITIDPDSVFESLPYNLTGWKLNLDAIDADGSVNFWDSLGKTTELDNSGTGDETYDFGSTIASGDVPSDVFVDVNAAGTDTLQLALVAPSDSTPPSSPPVQSAKVTGQGAKLIGETVNNTSGIIQTAILPSNVQQSQGTFVPLSNEDQNYKEVPGTNALILDMNQREQLNNEPTNTSPLTAIPNDEFLMPFEVNVGATPAYSDYSFEIPNGIRVWTTGDRTGQIMSGQVIDSLFTGGVATFYIEGIAQGQTTLYLDAKIGGVTTRLPTSLPITVFTLTGPQNVPNYSIYSYGATGLPAATSPSWSVSSQGKLTTPTTNGTASIMWGSGAVQGEAYYTANTYYTWTYYVNIVQVTIHDPADGSFQSDPKSGVQQIAPDLQNPDHLPSVKIATGLDAGQPSIEPAADVTMIGPNAVWATRAFTGQRYLESAGWGVDQLTVGLTQIVESTNIEADYGAAGSREFSIDSATPLQDTGGDSTTAWYFSIVNNAPRPAN